MQPVLGRFEAQILAIMRIVVGLLFACHGAQKILGILGGVRGGGHVSYFSLFGLAGIIELVGGLMIVLGIYAAYAAFIASGEMAVAYFMAHASRAFWPIQNGGELAVLYCFVFLFIAAKGSGAWSLTRK
jgi:putative oxidoreductase